MIGRYKRIIPKEDKEEEFLGLFKQFDALVKKQEPNCILHEIYKSPFIDRTYIVVEQYKDQAAVDDHKKSEQVYFDIIRPLLESASIETFTFDDSKKISV